MVVLADHRGKIKGCEKIDKYLTLFTQSAGAVEYTNCIFAEG